VGAGDILVIAGISLLVVQGMGAITSEQPLKLGRTSVRCSQDAVCGPQRSRRSEFKFFNGGNNMKPSTEDEVAGKIHEVKGKIKEKAGQLTNDPDLEVEGRTERAGGKVQKKIGQVEKVLGK
jgi:uncharacterized protein YjbJ (UPF0337 family)